MTEEEEEEEHQKAHESFVAYLSHYEQQGSIPEVDPEFIQRFGSLDDEGQYKAMAYIERLSTPATSDVQKITIHEMVSLGRLKALYKAWYRDQTKDWVDEYYGETLSDARWQRHLAQQRAEGKREEDTLVRKISNGEAPLPGEESVYEDAVIAALSEEAKEILGL